MSGLSTKVVYQDVNGKARNVSPKTPLPVTTIGAGTMAAAVLATGVEVNVVLAGSAAQPLFATPTLCVSALIQRATANNMGLLIGYMALPDKDQPLSLPAIPGVVYDLAQVVVKGTTSAGVNVVYFTY